MQRRLSKEGYRLLSMESIDEMRKDQLGRPGRILTLWGKSATATGWAFAPWLTGSIRSQESCRNLDGTVLLVPTA